MRGRNVVAAGQVEHPTALRTFPEFAGPVLRIYETGMTAFIFRCPATGYSVQGMAAEPDVDVDTYQSIKCPACARTHLVNPKTGKVAGSGHK